MPRGAVTRRLRPRSTTGVGRGKQREVGVMTSRKILEIGGIVAGVILIAFGIGALVMSINARSTVSDELTQQQIVGSPDMNPTDIQAAMSEAKIANVVPVPTCNVADKAIE